MTRVGDDISSRDDEIVSWSLLAASVRKLEHSSYYDRNHTLASLSPKAGRPVFRTCRSRKYIVSSI